MKYLLLFHLFICFPHWAHAQHTYGAGCPSSAYCRDCGETKATYKGNLIKYFEKEVNWVTMSKLSGVIVVKVLIDSMGNPCSNTFYNHTTVDAQTIQTLRLDILISRMGKWNPAIMNGKPVDASVMLAIYSRVQKHKMFDVNYLRNDKERKWVVGGKDGKPITNYDDINDLSD